MMVMTNNFFKIWLVTALIFLLGDFLWLSLIMNKFFVPQIKHLMNATSHGVVVNYVSALAAYLLVSWALAWFVVMPMFQESLTVVGLNGALLGFCLYGVYEFTNHATLNGWPFSFLVVDVLWGTLWCGAVSAITVWVLG